MEKEIYLCKKDICENLPLVVLKDVSDVLEDRLWFSNAIWALLRI